MNRVWVTDDCSASALDNFINAMNAIQKMLVNYQFFQKELSVLLFNDPELAEINTRIRKARFEEIEKFFEHLIESGAMRRPSDEQTLFRLIRIGWLIGDYWLDFLYIEGSPLSDKNIEECVELIREILRPYLIESQ